MIVNIIGLFTPKIIKLLSIWIPKYTIEIKLILSIILLGETLLVYDIHRPGHSGKIYRLTKNMNFDKGEVVVSLIQLVIPLIYVVVAILFSAMIPLIFEGIYLILCLFELVSNLYELRRDAK